MLNVPMEGEPDSRQKRELVLTMHFRHWTWHCGDKLILTNVGAIRKQAPSCPSGMDWKGKGLHLHEGEKRERERERAILFQVSQAHN